MRRKIRKSPIHNESERRKGRSLWNEEQQVLQPNQRTEKQEKNWWKELREKNGQQTGKKGEYHYMYRAEDDDSHNCETNVTYFLFCFFFPLRFGLVLFCCIFTIIQFIAAFFRSYISSYIKWYTPRLRKLRALSCEWERVRANDQWA